MKLNRNALRPPRIEMLPLIDIVFLLLVFFIYAMLSMAVHRGMQLDLPESSQAGKTVESPLSLSILAVDSEIKLFLNKLPVSLAELHHHLTTGRDTVDRPKLLVFADKDISYQQLYLVLDELKKSGIKDISLQASTE